MIYLGTDHAGFTLKELAKQFLDTNHITYTDCGAQQLNLDDDYPDYGFAVAEAVAQGKGDGMLFCESAGGMTICANKVRNVRAVECATPEEVKHAREQNNANILVISHMAVPDDRLSVLIQTWLTARFTSEERHVRRLNKIIAFEDEHLK